jgi:hypothetical protein
LAGELAAELARVAPWTAAPTFERVVVSWAWAEAQAGVLRRWLDEHGVLDENGEQRPAATMLASVEGRLAGLRAQLGLTPLALARLLAMLGTVDADRGEQGLEALRRAGAELRAAADRRLAPALAAGDAEDAGQADG